MLRNKLLYAAILAGLLCFYVLYIDYLPLMLLICTLTLPFLLLAGLIWLHFSSDARLETTTDVCETGSSIPVTVVIENRCPLPFPKGSAKLRVTHGFGAGRETFYMEFPLHPRNCTRLTFQVRADSCGVVTAELVHLHVYDLLRLFHIGIRRQRSGLNLLFLPRPIELPLEASAPPVENPESDRYADKPGDDPSELFGIREYQPGDPVSRIHWKLSSRGDTLYLKEFGAPIDRNVLLLVEFCPPAGQDGDLNEANALLTLTYSLAFQLIAENSPCTIAWYHTEKDETQRFSVTDEASLQTALRALFDAVYSIGSEEAALRYALGGELFSSAVLLSNLPETQMIGILEHTIAANHRTALLIGGQAALHSENTDIFSVPPDTMWVERIIV